MRNVRAFQDYIHMTTYNRISEKRPCVPIRKFYILIWFYIQRYFCTSLFVRVSDSGQPVNCTRKYFTKITCHNLHNYTLECFIGHNTFIPTHMIQHTNTCLCHPINCIRKYCNRKNCHNLHNYTHSGFTHHHTLIQTTKIPHQTESIQK